MTANGLRIVVGATLLGATRSLPAEGCIGSSRPRNPGDSGPPGGTLPLDGSVGGILGPVDASGLGGASGAPGADARGGSIDIGGTTGGTFVRSLAVLAGAPRAMGSADGTGRTDPVSHKWRRS